MGHYLMRAAFHEANKKAVRYLKFGDIVENLWACEENANRVMVFTRKLQKYGSRCLELTDMNGHFTIPEAPCT